MVESMMTFEISKIGHSHPSLVINIIWLQIPSPTLLFCVNGTSFRTNLSKLSSAMRNTSGYILFFPFVTLFLMVQLGMTWFNQDFSLSIMKKVFNILSMIDIHVMIISYFISYRIYSIMIYILYDWITIEIMSRQHCMPLIQGSE